MWKVRYDPISGRVLTKKTVLFEEPDEENALYFDRKPKGWHVDPATLSVVGTPIVGQKSNFPSLDLPEVIESPRKSSQNSICFVRLIGLGDVRMSIPAVAAFKTAYPDWHVTYATSYASSFMLRGVDAVDSVKVIEYQHPNKGLPAIPSNVGKEFTLVVNWINRVDFGDIVRARPRADNFIEVMNVRLESIGLDKLEIDKGYTVPGIPVYKEEYEWAQDYLIANGVQPEDLLVGCQLSSHGDCRVWAMERWIELAEMTPDWKFVFFSDKEEHTGLGLPENVIDTAMKLNIREFLALFASCHVCVYPDSAGMHLSPAFGTPGILLSGSTKVEYHLKYYPEVVHPIWSREKLDCVPCFDWQVWDERKYDAPPCYAKEGMPWCLNNITARQVTEKIEGVVL